MKTDKITRSKAVSMHSLVAIPFVALSYLLHKLNASLQIHTEVDKGPVNTFTLVLFLLKHEHVVVEELLELLIGEVDTQLLKAVELENNVRR